jgi:hypothetical protein
MSNTGYIVARPSSSALLGIVICVAGMTAMFAHAAFNRSPNQYAGSISLIQELGLTDLAIFTETRYTRHPSQADLHSAFQNHPLAFDVYPSGSIIPSVPLFNTQHNRTPNYVQGKP